MHITIPKGRHHNSPGPGTPVHIVMFPVGMPTHIIMLLQGHLDVCAAAVARDNDHRTEISGPHLPIEGLLNGCIANEDEVTALEIEVTNNFPMFAFKSDGCQVSGGVYSVFKCR